MKTTIKVSIIAIAILIFSFNTALTQNKVVVKKHDQKGNKVVVVKHNKHHVKKVKVYNPCWAPKANFHRRWVYFPRYNFYWDNYRNVYIVKTGTVWVVSKSVPNDIKSVDLSKEKSVELKEDTDQLDSIQVNNAEHLNEYKID